MPTAVADANAVKLTMDCSIVETQKTHLNREEHALLSELLRPGVQIEAVIPDDATPEDLWRTLDACSKGILGMEFRINRLKPIIGRILLIFENKPSLYRELGYDTYSEFMRKGVHEKLHLQHHTASWEARLLAKDWKQITPDRYPKIGPKKLGILSKFTKGSDPSAEMWLEKAETMSVGEFRQYAEQRGFIQPGETVGAVISITTNKAIEKQVVSFFNNPMVHEKVGSKDRGEILLALIQECSVEWFQTGQES